MNLQYSQPLNTQIKHKTQFIFKSSLVNFLLNYKRKVIKILQISQNDISAVSSCSIRPNNLLNAFLGVTGLTKRINFLLLSGIRVCRIAW